MGEEVMAENAIAVQEKPILFSGAMVRAIIEGRKTQTRRVMKPYPEECTALEVATETDSGRLAAICACEERGDGWIFCPYGKPGDRLWVRETFCLQCNVEDDEPPFSDGRPIRRIEDDDCGIEWYQPHYKATDPQPELTCPEDDARHNCGSEDICASPWKPSIHMPRWASRLTLAIVSVKVERVQEISFQDCLAEGVIWTEHWDKVKGADIERYVAKHPKEWTVDESINQSWEDYTRLAFQGLWDSINSKRGFGWEENPWVWAIEFKVLAAGDRRA